MNIRSFFIAIPLSIATLATGLSATSFAASGETRPDLYLNKHFGFNVEGYKYEQSELPCNIDKVLSEKIINDAKQEDILIEATGEASEIRGGDMPVLAIDIEALVLGSEEYTYGTKSRSNLPSARVTVALVKHKPKQSFTSAEHSCAIATLNELTPSSDILDLGSTGHTVCSAMEECLDDLSRDIVQWMAPQLP